MTWNVRPSSLSSLCHNCVRPLSHTPFPSRCHPCATFCCLSCLTTAEDGYHGREGDIAVEDVFGNKEEGGESPSCVFLAYR